MPRPHKPASRVIMMMHMTGVLEGSHSMKWTDGSRSDGTMGKVFGMAYGMVCMGIKGILDGKN